MIPSMLLNNREMTADSDSQPVGPSCAYCSARRQNPDTSRSKIAASKSSEGRWPLSVPDSPSRPEDRSRFAIRRGTKLRSCLKAPGRASLLEL
eukprot:scaffold385145_cov40-Prasinocladus_malaysianus.AAC.1